MAVDITVVRYLGDKPGDNIEEPLLCTEQAAIARGTAELNARSVAHKEVLVDVQYTQDIVLGQIVSATDSLSGVPVVGRVTGVRVSGSKAEPSGSGAPMLSMVLTIESPTNFAEV